MESPSSAAQWRGPLLWTLAGAALSTGLAVLILGGADIRWVPALVTLSVFFALPEIVKNPGRKRFFYIATGLGCVFCVYELGLAPKTTAQPPQPQPAPPTSPSSPAEDLEKQKRAKIRTDLAKLIKRSTEIKEKCLRDNPPVGFSCMNGYLRWNTQTRTYLLKKMESSYLARFVAIDETHMRYQKVPSGIFLDDLGEESKAVNLLVFCAKKLEEFIKELEN